MRRREDRRLQIEDKNRWKAITKANRTRPNRNEAELFEPDASEEA